MADLRAVFDINGIAPLVAATFSFGNTITFDKTQFGDSAAAGLAVTMTADATVDLTTDASGVVGKLLHVESDGLCSVQIAGGCLLAGGLAAALTAPSRIVGATGAAAAKGFIRNVAAATLAEVAVARHTIMSAADATKVQVYLS